MALWVALDRRVDLDPVVHADNRDLRDLLDHQGFCPNCTRSLEDWTDTILTMQVVMESKAVVLVLFLTTTTSTLLVFLASPYTRGGLDLLDPRVRKGIEGTQDVQVLQGQRETVGLKVFVDLLMVQRTDPSRNCFIPLHCFARTSTFLMLEFES